MKIHLKSKNIKLYFLLSLTSVSDIHLTYNLLYEIMFFLFIKPFSRLIDYDISQQPKAVKNGLSIYYCLRYNSKNSHCKYAY